MLTIGKVIVLAVVQGLTEMLPISSSGHLVLGKHLLNLQTPGATLEVALHAGTLLSVLMYYRRRIGEIIGGMCRGRGADWRYAGILLLGSVPAGVVGLGLKDPIESLFQRPALTAGMLCVTAAILVSTLLARRADRSVSFWSGFWIGAAQAVAIVPGISRSGATIAAARHLGIEPARAAEFSFLLAIPATLGAMAVTAGDMPREGLGDLTVASLAAGIAVSAVVGYAALSWLVRALKSGAFWAFGIYCLLAGLAGVILL
jgi:undecaprenyl-diphosphatase